MSCCSTDPLLFRFLFRLVLFMVLIKDKKMPQIVSAASLGSFLLICAVGLRLVIDETKFDFFCEYVGVTE